MKLYPKDGFIWKKELVGEEDVLRTRASMYAKATVWWENSDD